MKQIQIQKLLAGMVRGFRIVLASVFIFSLGIVVPAQAAGEPDLVINLSHTGNFQFQSVTSSTEVYTISVTNSGGSPTNGTTVTVTDTLPAGLTAFGISGSGWSCTLATLTCTRSDVLNPAASYPDITLTVTVDNDAPNSVDNQASVSGGGEIDTSNNTDIDPTTIAKSDLVITGVTLSPASPAPGQPFDVNVTVLNQGTSVSESVVYRDVYIDQDPSTIIDPSGCPSDQGDYYRSDYNDGLPAGSSDQKGVSISGGLSGSHQLWVYVDATCINNESVENNNVFGPILVDVGGFASGPTDINVTIAGTSQGTYPMVPDTSMVVKYLVDGGPVVISSNNGVGIIASLNQWRRNAAQPEGWFTGVAQSMALPVGQITNRYVMPRYNGTNPTLYDAVLMANVDTVPRTITVTIGGMVMGAYSLAPSASMYATYNITGGPIVVSSDVGAKIIASLYELKRSQAGVPWNGQSEMMGLPAGQLSDKYLLPIYFGAANPATLDARLYFANVDTVATTVEVKIAGVSRGTYPMAPSTSMEVKYLVDGGPVEISSNNGAKIVASLNQWRRNAAELETWFTGVAQSMALPVELITNQYVIPRYNGTDPTLYDAVLMANVDTVPRTITVMIGGTVMGTYPLAPSASVYATYPIADGPILVSSDVGAKIVASLYELKRYQAGVPWNGQSEMMGLPIGQLSDQYLLPIYFGAANPLTLDARLYIAVP